MSFNFDEFYDRVMSGASTNASLDAPEDISPSRKHALYSEAGAILKKDPEWIKNVVEFESAGGNPRAKNPNSTAKGLLQFTDTGGAAELGFDSSQELIDTYPDFESQMRNAVIPYLKKYQDKIQTEQDLYMAVFYPAAIGKGSDYVFPEEVQRYNPGIRTPADYVNKAKGRGTSGAGLFSATTASAGLNQGAYPDDQDASVFEGLWEANFGSFGKDPLLGASEETPAATASVGPEEKKIEAAPIPDASPKPQQAFSLPFDPSQKQDFSKYGPYSDEVERNVLAFHSARDARVKALLIPTMPHEEQEKAIKALSDTERQAVMQEADKIRKEKGAYDAFGYGLLASTPIPQLLPKESQKAMAEVMGEHPLAGGAGQFTGTMAQAMIGGSAIAKLATKVPVLQGSTLARAAVTRMMTSGAISAEQGIGRRELGEAMGDIAQSQGGALVSLAAEVLAPAGVAQLIAQPLADLVYDAGVDMARGRDVGSRDWWKREVLNLAVSSGFALRDIKSGEVFRADQAKQRSELAGWIKGRQVRIEENADGTIAKSKTDVLTPGLKVDILPGKEPSDATDPAASQSQGIPLAVSAAGGETIAPGAIAKRADQQPGDRPIGGDEESEEAARLEEIQSRIAETFPSEQDEAFSRLAPDEQDRIIAQIDAENEALSSAYVNLESSHSTAKTDLENERDFVEGATRLLLTARDELGMRTFKDEYRYLTGLAVRDKKGGLITRGDKTNAWLEKEAHLWNTQGAPEWVTKGRDFEGRGNRIPDSENDVYDKNADTWTGDDVARAMSHGIGDNKKLTKWRDDIEGRIFAEDERYEKETAEMASYNPNEAWFEEMTRVGKGAETYTRDNQAGAVGGQKQAKIRVTEADSKAAEAQRRFDQQRADARKKFGPSYKKFRDSLGSRLFDVNDPLVRQIEGTSDGDNAIMELRLSRGSSAAAESQYRDAQRDIFKTVPHFQEHGFGDFLQAIRTIEVEKITAERGRTGQTELFGDDATGAPIKSPIDGELSKAWLEELRRQDPKRYNSYVVAANKYWDTMRGQLTQLRDEGILAEDVYKNLLENHRFYSPRKFLQHIDPDGADGLGRTINVPDSGIKRLESGSEQALVNNPRLLLAQTILRTQTRIFKNRANKALHDYAAKTEANPLGIRVEMPAEDGKEQAIPTGYTRISSVVDGKRQAVLMPDAMAKSWVTSDPQINREVAEFVQWISGSKVVKPLATGLNPAFTVGNMPVDMAHILFQAKEYSSTLPIGALQLAKDVLKVLPDVVMRRGRVKQYLREGGGMNFLTDQGRYLKKPWETKSSTRETLDGIKNVMGWAGETSELLTRIALRERAMANGKSPKEATYIARNYLDFAQGGSWVKAADNAIPYLNASVQGTRGIIRAFKEDPKIALYKAAQVMAFSYAVAHFNRQSNPEATDEISDREKVDKWTFTLPLSYADANGKKRHHYIAIRKDQGQQLFSVLGEAMADRAAGVDGETVWNKIQMATTQLLPVTPETLLERIPAASALAAYFNNKDLWLNDEVWKGRKGISPKEEYTAETPAAWVALGKYLGVSPERTSRAVSKYVPAHPASWLTGAALDAVTGQLDERERQEVNKSIMQRLSESPITSRIIRTTWASGKSSDEIDEDAEKLGVKAKGKGERAVLKEIAEENTAVADMRMQNDREFDEVKKDGVIALAQWIRELDVDARESERLWRKYGDFARNVK